MCVKGMVKLDKNLIESNKRVLFDGKLSEINENDTEA